MSIIPEFQYLLVMPDGHVKGFNDLDTTKAYINLYYMKKVRNSTIITEVNDLTDSSEQFINTVCQNLGVIEGECRVYNTNDIISKDNKKVLNQSDMYLYIKDEDGQLKIKTADYGG